MERNNASCENPQLEGRDFNYGIHGIHGKREDDLIIVRRFFRGRTAKGAKYAKRDGKGMGFVIPVELCYELRATAEGSPLLSGGCRLFAW
jgi:hypothetical protein